MRPVDFDRVKELVSYAAVLKLLGWRHVRMEAGRHRGPCPVHHSTNPRGDSFAVGPMGWTCHKCKRNGDQLALWAQATGRPILEATLDLCGRLDLEVPYLARRPRQARKPRQPRPPRNRDEAAARGGAGGFPPQP
jgi:hypothetical protein